MQVEWEAVDDGEYNEIKATVNGLEVNVFSNRNGDDWDYIVEGDESSTGGFDTKQEAQEAAIADAMDR